MKTLRTYKQVVSTAHPALRILVVDDQILNLKILQTMLLRLGYEADIALNGQEAVTCVQQRTYDIVFMDIQMPIMDGITATQTIRALYPAPAEPTIIAVTAHGTPGIRARCMAAGTDEFLTKPLRKEVLQGVLERWDEQDLQLLAS